MKFSLSDSTLRKILIGTVVAIIVLFVVAKIIQKSFYVYPNTKEEQGPINITAITLGTTTTFTTASAHNFAAGEIVLVQPVTAGTTITPTFTLSAATTKAFANEIDPVTGGYVFVVETAPSTTTFTVVVPTSGTAYVTNTLNVQAAGKGVMTALKSGLNDCQIAHFNSTAGNRDATLTSCIQVKVGTYVSGHCKYLPVGGGVLTAPTDPYALNLYNEYLTNLTTVKTAYAQAFVNVASKIFGTGVSGVNVNGMNTGTTTPASVIVNAAYAADVFHVLRKYIAQVCPGFYAPSNSTTSDPTTLYLSWAAGPATQGSVRFTATAASPVSDSAIVTWAQYAVSNPTTTVDTVNVTPLINANIASAPLTDKSATGAANNQNWRKAMYIGPGTLPQASFT